jgi:hypothetical protein
MDSEVLSSNRESNMTTITAKTYKATLQNHGVIAVSGLRAREIADEHPDTTRAMARRDELRSEIITALGAAMPGWDGYVSKWSAQ